MYEKLIGLEGILKYHILFSTNLILQSIKTLKYYFKILHRAIDSNTKFLDRKVFFFDLVFVLSNVRGN